ncbi:MAG: hypothetical protein ABI823_03550 [Bryobacteraceae bacterium]
MKLPVKIDAPRKIRDSGYSRFGMSPRLLAAFLAISALYGDEKKLSFDQRIEIVRGLTAEYATAKVVIPRSKKNLQFEADGTFNKKQWEDWNRQFGSAARVGDSIQVTKVDVENEKIVLELNGGSKIKRKWTDHIEIGMGGSSRPANQGGVPTNAPSGTTLTLDFGKPLPPLQASEIKKILAPILDFDKHTVTENFVESLTPEMQQAIKDKRATVGMTRDEVLLAMGRPDHKTRETKDGLETEDWIYGRPPGKVSFVTFANSKVTKVKETYAGLGGSVAETPKQP